MLRSKKSSATRFVKFSINRQSLPRSLQKPQRTKVGAPVVYSPLGILKLEQYRARMQKLVKDGLLTQREADLLIAIEMRRVADRVKHV